MRWVKDNESALHEADPAMPDGVHGRGCGQLAAAIGHRGHRRRRVAEATREIAVKASGRAAEIVRALLLEDLAKLFAEKGVDRMASVAICEALAKWRSAHGPSRRCGQGQAHNPAQAC